MKNKLLNYGFGITVYYLDDIKNVRFGLGTAEPDYQMLNYLSEYNSSESVSEVLNKLLKVKNGDTENWVWGTDFCLITSYKEKSIIQHHINPKTREHELDPLYEIEISTDFLYKMMNDWNIFLENNIPIWS